VPRAIFPGESLTEKALAGRIPEPSSLCSVWHPGRLPAAGAGTGVQRDFSAFETVLKIFLRIERNLAKIPCRVEVFAV
jgi:hypothetical protein